MDVDVVETVADPLAKLAVQVRVRGVQSPNSLSGAQKRVYRLNAPFMLSLKACEEASSCFPYLSAGDCRTRTDLLSVPD